MPPPSASASTLSRLTYISYPQDLSQVVHECNQRFSRSIRKLMPEADDVVFISVDKRGVELRVRIGSEDTVRRIKFNEHCYSAEDVVKQLEEIIET